MAFAFAGQWGPEPVVDRYGNAIYSATFRVLTTAGAEATVYTDRTKATTVSQPLDVDGEANATFYAAPGRYTLELTAGGSVTSFPVGVVPDAEDVEPAPDVAAQFAETATLIDSALTVTVGTGGDYATINAALEALSKRHAAHVAAGFTATVNLLTGFVMAEQVKLQNVDLSWITITSADAEVLVDTSAIPAGEGVWHAVQNATLPTIGCFFRADTSGDARATPALRGFDIMRGSTVIFDRLSAGFGDDTSAPKVNRLLQVIHGSVCVATAGMTLNGGNDIGVRVANAAVLSAPGASITNAAANNVSVASGGIVQMPNASVTGAGTGSNINVSNGPAIVEVAGSTLTGSGAQAINAGGPCHVAASSCDLGAGGVLANGGAHVYAENATSTGNYRVLGGSFINATGATGGRNQTANLWTRSGFILDTAVTSEAAGSFVGSGDGAATAFTIAHGLGVTPAAYTVQSQNSVTADKHWVTADATNLTITYATAPVAGTNNLRASWWAKASVTAGT